MMPARTSVSKLVSLLSIFAVCACSTEADREQAATWEAVHDTIGDTVIVHTVSGSVWGDTAILVPEVSIGMLEGPEEYTFGQVYSLAQGDDGTIFVVDRQVPALRVYEPDGTYRTTFGRAGGGPGEYERPDGGLAVLSDGRVLLRDPANARIQVYSPEGEPLDEWRIRGGFNTSSRMVVDTQDRAYTIILLDVEADVTDWRSGLVQILPDGTPGDTLEVPDTGYEGPRIEARREGEDGGMSVSVNGVPFSPSEDTALSPGGYFIHGISTDYTLTLLKPGRPIRIVKDYEPVPVAGGEKREEEAFAIRDMRQTDPAWKWDGPPIPDRKPPYRDIQAGEDGTVWILVSQPGIRRDDPDYDPTDADAIADEWYEPIVYDVFDDDGSYLGAVRTPAGFSPYPAPLFTREEVLATVRDEYDVQSVVRFRVELPAVASD
ncbi:MAG: 6-bladed beta-propeller [marine benthic group bacterium]|nr:6-bladed beta-propeller [Gemmatimonadota bacterium]